MDSKGNRDTPAQARRIQLGLLLKTGKLYRIEPVGRAAPGAILVDIQSARTELPTASQERAELERTLGMNALTLPKIVPSHGRERDCLVAMQALGNRQPSTRR